MLWWWCFPSNIQKLIKSVEFTFYKHHHSSTVYSSVLKLLTYIYLILVQVRQLQENAAQLRTIYAGEKAEAILVKEQEVMEAWKELLSSCEASRVQVTSVTDKVQFFSVVRENLMWMEGIMGQIGWDEPR